MFISVDDLIDRDACDSVYNKFRSMFPNGVRVTIKGAVAVAGAFGWSSVAYFTLTKGRYKRFHVMHRRITMTVAGAANHNKAVAAAWARLAREQEKPVGFEDWAKNRAFKERFAREQLGELSRHEVRRKARVGVSERQTRWADYA